MVYFLRCAIGSNFQLPSRANIFYLAAGEHERRISRTRAWSDMHFHPRSLIGVSAQSSKVVAEQ